MFPEPGPSSPISRSGLRTARVVGAAAKDSDSKFPAVVHPFWEAKMSMKTLLKLAIGGGVAAIIFGCGGGYPSGSLYTGTQTPHGMDRTETSGAGKSGDKHGEACATGILGLVAFGDASLD